MAATPIRVTAVPQREKRAEMGYTVGLETAFACAVQPFFKIPQHDFAST